MSYKTGVTCGYGIKVDDIGEVSAVKIKELLDMAPKLEKEYDQGILRYGISIPTAQDYFDYLVAADPESVAALLKEVIQESEGITLETYEDMNGKQFLLYLPVYPWLAGEVDFKMKREYLDGIFTKYTKVLTDSPIKVEYQSV